MAETRVLVTGATGFIGRRLVGALAERGHRVTAFVRSERQVPEFPSPLRAVVWNAAAPGTWCDVLSEVDAVVHLTGEQAVGVRWTVEAKRRIESSRVDTTRALVAAIAAASPVPRVLVSASAVGYYGAREGASSVDESATPGSDFLARLCVAWEGEALEAASSGVRVVLARLGIVLGKGGGALDEMAKPFRLFAGGPIGSGEQVISWVHVDDVIGMLMRSVEDDGISGPVNVVAPGAVTQAELARAIGKALGRPSWLRVPGAALRLRFGEGAEPLLTGQRAVPGKMKAAGYVWHHASVESALGAALS